MNEITLTLTVAEVDYIGRLLLARPFQEVEGLIQKIREQANANPPAVAGVAAAAE